MADDQPAPSAPRAPVTAADLVAAAQARVRALTPGETVALVAAGAVLVDVREREELEYEGIIPGAVHVPRGVLEFVADPASPLHDLRLSPDRRIVLYCSVGGRSALAAETLAQLGYVDVAHLDGGLGAWTAAGCAVAPYVAPGGE
jgi:rhodanese-related sulfurtransferase